MNRAFSRFRPMLTLEPSASAPMVLRGIPHAWAALEKPTAEMKWFERLLPIQYRLSFSAIEGLEAYAVNRAGDLEEDQRSAAWRRLLKWRSRYSKLDLPRKIALIEVLAQLCLYADVESLLAEGGVPLSGILNEAQSCYAYWRAFIPFMLYEGVVAGRAEAVLESARRATPRTRIRLIAALKYMVLNLEKKIAAPGINDARRIAEGALADLEDELSPAEALCWRSKFWRTVCYFPFHERDFKELARQLDLAESSAREAVVKSRRGGAFAVGFAAENLHAVLATRAITQMHLERPRDAMPWLREMIAMDPQGSWQRVGLGRALFALEEFEEARTELSAGLSLAAAGREDACRWLGKCEEKLGRAKEARLWRERAESSRSASQKIRTGGKPYIDAPLLK